MSARVIVRGMKEKWFLDHFKDMEVNFGGDPRGVPAQDAEFVGFYLEAPVSAITHIGVVKDIHRDSKGATFHLNSIIKLEKPVKTTDSHAIRKHEYWTLSDLGINQLGLIVNDFSIART